MTPPPISNSIVLAPAPRVSLIPETEPDGLISAVEAVVSTDLTSPPVPDTSKRTVLTSIAGMNDSSALPDRATSPSRPKIVLCGA